MNLNPGTRIGPYEVVSVLGAGGMGEVYAARDARLNRSVALKVLPAAFASDPDRLARFRREAQVLASLNHSNIAAIYGIEDSGDVHALVMELVPGRTLEGSKLDLTDALSIARQVALALEAAHEQNVIHRDLKPANVKITDDGTVKVLDFGLAKALAPAGASGASDVANSPTVTSPALTEMGVILGTAGYMAPEQAKGKPVDRRADIWALGVLLFEMLTGKSLYRGDTVTETIAHVITQPPDWTALPASTPATVRRLLRRCLEKDPRNRLQSAGDARIEIDEILSGPADDSTAGAPPSAARSTPVWRAAIPWVISAALLAALVFALRPKPAAMQPSARVDARVTAGGEELTVDPDADGSIAEFSPDGQTLVYLGSTTTTRRLYARRLDSLGSAPIPGTEGAFQHFFSPDGQTLAFFTPAGLVRMPVAGGTPTKVVATVAPRGATWGPGDIIVYTGDMTSGLTRISAGGGSSAPLTKLAPNERTHRWPSFLPDGKHVVFTCQLLNGAYDDGTIEAASVADGTRKVLVRGGTYPRYVASGHLVFVRQNALYAVPFDPDRLDVKGEPRQVLPGIMSTGAAVGAGSGNGGAQIAIASNGTAAYIPTSTPEEAVLRLAIVDRAGKIAYEYPETKLFRDPSFSPQGNKIAVRVTDGKGEQLYLLDPARGTLTKITFEGTFSGFPVWSHDGEQLAFASDRGGKGLEVYLGRADGTGEISALTSGGTIRAPTSFSPDDRLIAISDVNPKTNFDLMVFSRDDARTSAFLSSPNVEILGAFSPDGRWMAYQMVDNSGANEVFVRAYPDGSALRQVSSGGGFSPAWTKGGRELVYAVEQRGRTNMMAVEVGVEGKALRLGNPQKLFDLPLGRPVNSINFDVDNDGNRFVVLLSSTPQQAARPQRTNMTLVFNLFDELRRATGK